MKFAEEILQDKDVVCQDDLNKIKKELFLLRVTAALQDAGLTSE